MKKYLVSAALFLLGFAAAFAIMSMQESPGPKLEPPAVENTGAADTVHPAELQKFLAAVSAGDFPAMRETGARIFTKGRMIANAGDAFAGYGTNSFPPYTVYALHTENAPDAVRRALLTLDAEGRVESFLAEEMTIVK